MEENFNGADAVPQAPAAPVNPADVTKAELAKYDYVLMIDKSGSMSTADCGGKTRWEHAQEQTETIARKCAEFDDDGIDVVVFGTHHKLYSGTTPDKVAQIFQENEPSGGTDTAGALQSVIDDYFARRNAGGNKPTIIICVTDGVPDNESALASVIVNTTKKMHGDRKEIGINFVQVGSDQHAKAFLNRLDDNLTSEGEVLDIVDSWDDEKMADTTITEILIGAITD